MRSTAAKTVFLLSLSLFQMHGFALEYGCTGLVKCHAGAFISSEGRQPHIEWFKKEMGISSKYTERESGVMGLSWAHFLTMVFLVLSFVVALIALILRYRRTKELLRLILKEGSRNDGEG